MIKNNYYNNSFLTNPQGYGPIRHTLGSTIGHVNTWGQVEAPGGYSTGLRFDNNNLVNTFGTRVGRVDTFGVVRDSLGCDTGMRFRNW